jgi:DNA polymerase-3 subunit epsilon
MPPKPWIPELLIAADRGDTFHVTDTETTGSSARGARVIELATVSVRNGAIVGRFETLIDPGVFVPSWITQLTGIHTAMLKGAPRPSEAWQAWLGYLAEVDPRGADAPHFVAHNAGFDWNFLLAEFERDGRPWPFAKKTCTVQVARHCLPQLGSRSLETLIAHYGIAVDDRHRALADAEATAIVFLNLLGQLREELAPA